MNTNPPRRTAIARLLSLISQPQHPYRPATHLFLDLNVNHVADELQLQKAGSERGAQDWPTSDAQTFDDIEHGIVERVEAHRSDNHAIFLEQLHLYDQRLIGLNFEERFAIIQQAAPEAVGDFRAEATIGGDELYELRRRLKDSEVERDNFRSRHRIARPARLSTPGKTLLKIGILAILFVLEVVINGSFLASANEQGYLGGAVQAVSFAALNIVASFLFGLIPVRLLIRRNIFLKFTGLLSLIAYLCFALALNLALSNLREIPPSLTSLPGQQVLAKLLTNPFMLTDVNSWVFFAMGFTFSLVAMFDGLFFTDPYMGYASLERRWSEASKRFTEHKAGLIERLQEIRRDATDAMTGAARDLSVRRSEFDSIVQGRGRLAQSFAQSQNQTEQAGRSLLSIYREANRKARRTPPPAYFTQPYTMERITVALRDMDPGRREQLLKDISDSQTLLKEQTDAIHKAFEVAMNSFRNIDELLPERAHGQTTG